MIEWVSNCFNTKLLTLSVYIYFRLGITIFISLQSLKFNLFVCREQMERKLKDVREEVESLQKDEYTRLEREKKAMLESIKQEVQ